MRLEFSIPSKTSVTRARLFSGALVILALGLLSIPVYDIPRGTLHLMGIPVSGAQVLKERFPFAYWSVMVFECVLFSVLLILSILDFKASLRPGGRDGAA
jgi:hypothetical protein